jgi:hypothetical protein
MMLFTQQRG